MLHDGDQANLGKYGLLDKYIIFQRTCLIVCHVER